MKLDMRSLLRKPSNVKEANEKRDTSKLLMLGSIGAAVLCTVLGSAIGIAILESLGMFIIVAAVIFFVIWLSAKKDASRLQSVFCECGERFRFPDDVVYEIVKEQISSGKEPNSTNVQRHTNTYVAFHCTCHNCSNTHDFTSRFVTKWETFNDRGLLLRFNDYPLEGLLEKFFRD